MRDTVHQPATPFRLGVIVLLVVLACAALVWRAVDLHVFNKQFLQNQGDARALRVEQVSAHRGMITDRFGEPLAISTPVDSIWVQPKRFWPGRRTCHNWLVCWKPISNRSNKQHRIVMARSSFILNGVLIQHLPSR